MNTKIVKAIMVTMLFWVGIGTAKAGMVVYQDVGFLSSQVQKEQPASFTISSSGKYQVQLVDFAFPESFKKLELTIIDASNAPLHEVARLNSPGNVVFDALPGIYYAALYGESGSVLGLALYGIQVSQLTPPAPVPLPAAGLLLGTALLSLTPLIKRSRKIVTVMA